MEEQFAVDLGASRIQRARQTFRKTVVGMMGKSQFGAECSICYCDFAPGQKVEQFACHPTHMLHE